MFEMFVPLRIDRLPSVRSASKQSFTQLIRWKLDQEEARASQFMWDCKTLLCIVSELNIETMAHLVGSNINRSHVRYASQNWWLQGRKVAEITAIVTWKVTPQASKDYSCPIWSPWRNASQTVRRAPVLEILYRWGVDYPSENRGWK